MYALAYLLYLGLAVFLCRRLAKRGTQSRKKTVLCSALGVVLVLLPHWDVVLGIPTMRKLCAEEGGLQVREEVKFPLSSVMVVSRYGSGSPCLACFKLLASGLAVETYAEVSSTDSGLRYGLINESGVARYWTATLGDQACAGFLKVWKTDSDRRALWKNAGATYDGKSCIASERVPVATPDFILTDPTPTTIERGVVTVRSMQIALTRTHETRPIATLTHFMQEPWNEEVFYFGIPPAPSCPDFVRPIIPDNFDPEYLPWILSGQLQYQDIIE